MAEHERLLSYKDVGARLGFSRTAVFELVRSGKFPTPLRIGRARRWRESDVDRWIAALAERSDGASTDAGATA